MQGHSWGMGSTVVRVRAGFTFNEPTFGGVP